MTTIPTANEDLQRAHTRNPSVQTYARLAGVLFLISLVAGGFGEFVVPNALIVSADATATANNIRSSESLFRLGFASYLIEALCDVALTLVLYVLLRPAGRDLALLAAFLRLLGTAVFAGADALYFAALPILTRADHLKVFSPDQVNSLALLSVNLGGYGGAVAVVFYGAGFGLFGYLMLRSGYFPWALGALVALSGVAFVTRSFALVLAPAYASTVLYLPVPLAGLALTAWLLVKGIDVPRWEAKAARADFGSSP